MKLRIACAIWSLAALGGWITGEVQEHQQVMAELSARRAAIVARRQEMIEAHQRLRDALERYVIQAQALLAKPPARRR